MLFTGPEEPLTAHWRWWRGGRTPLSKGRQSGTTQASFSLWQPWELCSKPQPLMQPELAFVGLAINLIALCSSNFQ